MHVFVDNEIFLRFYKELTNDFYFSCFFSSILKLKNLHYTWSILKDWLSPNKILLSSFEICSICVDTLIMKMYVVSEVRADGIQISSFFFSGPPRFFSFLVNRIVELIQVHYVQENKSHVNNQSVMYYCLILEV